MATADQSPGILNVGFTRGEAWGLVLDFDQPASLVGYTVTARAVQAAMRWSLYSALTLEW